MALPRPAYNSRRRWGKRWSARCSRTRVSSKSGGANPPDGLPRLHHSACTTIGERRRAGGRRRDPGSALLVDAMACSPPSWTSAWSVFAGDALLAGGISCATATIGGHVQPTLSPRQPLNVVRRMRCMHSTVPAAAATGRETGSSIYNTNSGRRWRGDERRRSSTPACIRPAAR